MKKNQIGQIGMIGTAILASLAFGACRMDVDSISGKADPNYHPGEDYSSSEAYLNSCTQWRLVDVSTGTTAGTAAEPAADPSPDPSPSSVSSSGGGSSVSSSCEAPESAILDAGAVYDSSGSFLRLEIRVREFADGTFPEVAGLIYQSDESEYDSEPAINVDFNCDPPSVNQGSAFARIDCVPAADTSGKIVSTEGDVYSNIQPFAITLRHKSCGVSVTYQAQLKSLQGDACNYGYSSTGFDSNPSVRLPFLEFQKQ